MNKSAERGHDAVNHPIHYNTGGIETLDYIKAKIPHYASFAIGNIIKYVSRYENKNGIEDLKKGALLSE
ncbi:gp62 protein [Listeria fleischmannii FSL S10-1203]|uniref:Gp62 protein n=1 Tax=Listeria fleischmannii FSL S10-1203 TaxID=1265822 RepID=W7DGH2_9LIST|nr:gp62 protein [Listeria fleischmannii FSL S10-1203]